MSLLVQSGGRASIDYWEFSGPPFLANTVQIGSDAFAGYSGGTALFRTAIASSTDGRTARLLVDGAGGSLTSVTMGDFTGYAASGGTVEILVKNGSHVSVNRASLINDPLFPPPAAGDVHISVDGTGSTFEGAVDMPRDPSNDVFNEGAKIDFTNGAACHGCNLNVSGRLGRPLFDSNSRATVSVGKNGAVTRGLFTVSAGANASFIGGATIDSAELHVGDGGSATVSNTAAASFDRIQIDAGGPSGSPTNLTIFDSNPGV